MGGPWLGAISTMDSRTKLKERMSDSILNVATLGILPLLGSQTLAAGLLVEGAFYRQSDKPREESSPAHPSVKTVVRKFIVLTSKSLEF